MNEIALVRSLTTLTGDHEQGNYLMHTSFTQLNSIRHPGLGAWAAHALPKKATSLPANVLIGSSAGHPGSGFLPANIAPVPIPNAAAGLENTKSPSYLADDQFKHRMSLANQYDQTFKRAYDSRLIEAYDQTYREAVRLMSSPELKVFDIKQEEKRFARCTVKMRSAKDVCSRGDWFKRCCASSKLNLGRGIIIKTFSLAFRRWSKISITLSGH